MSKIEVKNVYKIFGNNPSKVLPMVQDGATKEDILEKEPAKEETKKVSRQSKVQSKKPKSSSELEKYEIGRASCRERV